MIGGRATPTRQYLIEAERSLARLGRGVDLLRRKREALVTTLFKLAAPAVEAQARIADQAARAHRLLADALGDVGEPGVRAMAWPAQRLQLELEPSQVWGLPAAGLVDVPRVERTRGARATPANSISASVSLAADAYEDLLGQLLRSAPQELLLRRLAEALSRTSRQVNALERRVAPRLRASVARVRQQLEEREREELVRLGAARRGGRLDRTAP